MDLAIRWFLVSIGSVDQICDMTYKSKKVLYVSIIDIINHRSYIIFDSTLLQSHYIS